MSPLAVMLVDANATFRRSTILFLQEHCADTLSVVGAASEFEDAVALATSLRPHLVLFGLRITVHPDLQRIRRLRQILPESGIIALSVLDVDGYQELILAAGGDGIIPKDALKQRLIPTVERVMRGYR